MRKWGFIRTECSGVRCIKSFVSKRGYEFRGLGRFAGKLHHENPGKRTFVPTFLTFTKRYFLYNAPLYLLVK